LRVPDLEAYDHITGLGRDQYIRIVRRGRLNTGHEASHVEEFRRVFVADPDGGIIAFLQRQDRVIVKQPEVAYGAGIGYPHDGREMPFSALRITDRVTPPIKPPVPAPQEFPDAPLKDLTAFWVQLQDSGKDHLFTLIGTDREVEGSRKVSFKMPLIFVPDGLGDPEGNVSDRYAEPEPDQLHPRMTPELHGQTMAMAQPPDGAPGSTTHAVESLTFGRGTVGLPFVSDALVRVHAVEQLLPNAGPLAVRFNDTYLEKTMAGHPAGAYLELAADLPLAMGAEQAGGLANPQTFLKTITSQAGVVPEVFGPNGNGLVASDVAKLFQGAKLLGFINLSALLGDVVEDDLNQFRDLSDEQITRILGDPKAALAAPVLRVRDLAGGQGKELRYVWKTQLTKDPKGLLVAVPASTRPTLTLDARTVRSPGAVDSSTVEGSLTDFGLAFGAIEVDFAEVRFKTGPGRKPDVTASGLVVKFRNELQFINTLRDALPADVFGAGAFVDVQPTYVSAGYTLAVPTIALGVFTLSNLTLGATLTIPLDGSSPVSFRFSVSEQQHPFNVSVSLFGGGGYFSMLVDLDQGVKELEGSIEFGGCAAVDVGVAAGGVSLMAGVSFVIEEVGGQRSVTVSGYVRFNGFLSVLGIVTVSIEFYLELTYASVGGQSSIKGSGKLTVSVRLVLFSTSVSIPFSRTFAGSPNDPSFELCMPKPHWRTYCAAFHP
ncbi:hypothetical protein ACFC0P_38815, partial [Streptomyces broussonetiae]